MNSHGLQAPKQTPSRRWQDELRTAIRTPAELANHLELPPDQISRHPDVLDFPIFAPRAYLSRIEPGNPNDPLLKQILPLDIERTPDPADLLDPLQESQYQLTPGLLQKYPGRALLVVNGRCAIHCRYCFRRHFPYDQTPQATGQWQPAVESIAADPSIQEVILSGGDPLTMPDPALERLLDSLSQTPTVARVRIHTRLPIAIPSRVTPELIRLLNAARPQIACVVHSNHPNELDAEVTEALKRLRDSTQAVLNQAVLLAGINDHLPALVGLSERLFRAGALPYYLHQLDPVAGARHFQVPISRGRELVHQMRDCLPGYLVPRYVQEIPGRLSKTILE